MTNQSFEPIVLFARGIFYDVSADFLSWLAFSINNF
jgi:hypothetical protein